MKISKYSKRYPANGGPVRERDKEKSNTTVVVSPKKEKPNYLEEYDFGIFIDDNRSLEQVTLPKAKHWEVFKSYGELRDFLADYIEEGKEHSVGTFPFPNVFISFDHYLDTKGMVTGDDCLEICRVYKNQLGNRVDIQGHSSEQSMNVKKINRWYNVNTANTPQQLKGLLN